MSTEQQAIDSSYDIEDGYRQDVVFTDCFVGFDQQYQSGETPIFIFEYEPVDGGETRQKFFSFGEDSFNIAEDGRSISHKSGAPKAPGGRTNYGKLLKSAIALPGVAKVLKSRGPSTNCDIWVGLAFEMVDLEFPPAKEGQKPRRETRLEAFYPSLCRPPIGDAATATTAAPAPAEVAMGSYGVPLSVENALTDLAKASTSHEEFQTRALAELPGVEGDPSAEALITDAGFYTEARGA